MSLTKAKIAVSEYFKGKKAAHRLLNSQRISANSDFFELYVLVRLAKISGGVVVPHFDKSGAKKFYVAGSPSPYWSSASYIVVKTFGARTGLQVQCANGSVELDVVLVELSKIAVDDTVPASAAHAAHECKALRGRLKTTHANEILGKAFRVWGALPLTMLTANGCTSRRYSAAAVSGSTAGLGAMLAAYGIDMTDTLSALNTQISDLVAAL